MEGVAINEITEAADVGFGSFYNHFASKEAIYSAVLDWLFEDFSKRLDQLTVDIADIAEVVSIGMRHTLRRAQREPLWGQFLLREGLSTRALNRGLGQRLMRDIRKGISAGRFRDADPLMSFLAIAGTSLVSIAVASSDIDLGYSMKNLPERAAKTALRILGIGEAEAERISRLPLPGP